MGEGDTPVEKQIEPYIPREKGVTLILRPTGGKAPAAAALERALKQNAAEHASQELKLIKTTSLLPNTLYDMLRDFRLCETERFNRYAIVQMTAGSTVHSSLAPVLVAEGCATFTPLPLRQGNIPPSSGSRQSHNIARQRRALHMSRVLVPSQPNRQLTS